MNNKILSLILCGAALIGATACASKANLKNPPPGHIVSTIGSGKSLGIAASEAGTANLGYQSIMADVLTVPVQLITDTNGDEHFVSPEAVVSYEIKGNTGGVISGSAGSTLTIAIGPASVGTWLGGMHYPINSPSNSLWQAQPPLSTSAAAAATK